MARIILQIIRDELEFLRQNIHYLGIYTAIGFLVGMITMMEIAR